MRLPRRFHPVALNTLLVGVLLLSAAQMASPTRFAVDAGTLEVTVTPALPGGRLRLPLGPFGELTWRTHRAPLNVEANFILSRKAASLPSAEQFDGLPRALLRDKLPWLVLLAVSAGVLIGEGSRRARAVAGSFAAAAILAAGVGAGAAAAATFDGDALADPRYRGPIEDAPRVIALIKEIRRDLPGTRRNITRVVAGLQRLHADVLSRRTVPSGGDLTTYLAISDVHNNPLGLLIAQSLVREFDVEVVLNAGDFTDRGTAPEGELFASLGAFGVPQYIAPGNHEDADAVRRVRQIPGAHVFPIPQACPPDASALACDDAGFPTTGMIAGGVLGAADPNSAAVGSDPRLEAEQPRYEAICSRLASVAATEAPALMLVHDIRLANCAADAAVADERKLVVVYGHDHKANFMRRGSVVFVNPGTSGANGVKSATEGDYGFALIDFDDDSLSSVCLFSFEAPERPREVSCHLSE